MTEGGLDSFLLRGRQKALDNINRAMPRSREKNSVEVRKLDPFLEQSAVEHQSRGCCVAELVDNSRPNFGTHSRMGRVTYEFGFAMLRNVFDFFG